MNDERMETYRSQPQLPAPPPSITIYVRYVCDLASVQLIKDSICITVADFKSTEKGSAKDLAYRVASNMSFVLRAAGVDAHIAVGGID